jgi:hypothetical protein
MIKGHITTTLVLFFGVISFGQSQSLLNPVNVAPRANISASSFYENDGRFGPDKVADYSTADNYGNGGNYWMAKGVNDSMQGTLPAWLRFDLLEVYDLSSVSILNTVNQQYMDSGTKDFNIQLSQDGLNYSAPVISGRLDWQNDTFQNFDFSNIFSARYVQFNLVSAYVNVRDLQRVGLNEVKINAVPEPSALSLCAVGLGALAMMRRRRS